MIELNVPILKDPADGNAAGASWYTMSLNPKDQSRSTSQGFYTPQRKNLHLLTYNQVTKLQTISRGSETIATRVEYATADKAKKHSVLVSKEVVLAAGTFHTPQILQLSGIGDSRHLSSLGIKTLVDLPGVGANYHDHVLSATVQTCKSLAEAPTTC
jgi:choline dehydrogenase-like flavoprotein